MDRKIVHFLWVLLIVTVTAIAGAVYAIAEGWIGYMPPIEDLQNPINRFATQVYSSDGKLMGTWNYNKENRVCVDYDQLAPSLIKALVATEDVRFHEHSGIDFKALARAIIKRGILGQKNAGGGYYDPDFSSAARYVCAPPIRSQEDSEALWKALRRGEVQTISTDHCSFTLEQKDMGRDEQQHPQHRLDGAVLAHAQVRDQKQQTQQKKRRELRK